MNYDLAKKLKDAGFPLKAHTNQSTNQPNAVVIDCVQYIFPTLEEIIEACGYGFRSLSLHTNGRWIAKAGKSNGGSQHSSKHSAKEAVAKLYLALNK